MDIAELKNPILIVGAGVAGLTLAYHLAKAGKPVIILEQEDRVGGLARSFHYDGFTFDMGPHRFFTDDQEVIEFIREILGNDYLSLKRKSGVYMFGKYFEWPLSFTSLFKLPVKVMVDSFFDLISRRNPGNPESYSDYIVHQYGKTLYEVFFKNYTEKFIRIPCEEVHTDWAMAGINRTVFDKNVKVSSLLDLVKGVLLPVKVDTDFLYPREPGIESFCIRLRKALEMAGGKVRTGVKVTEIKNNRGAVKGVKLSDGLELETELLVWSGDLPSLAKLLGLGPYPLRFLSTICFNAAVEGLPETPYQWVYFGDHRVNINRISLPHRFNPACSPAGYYGINAEITCFEGDHTWLNPHSLVNLVKQDLLGTKFVTRKEKIKQVWVEKLRSTYPIYDLPYRKNTAKVMQDMKQFRGLMLMGRQGRFWYNNMDHTMRMAMDYSKHIVSGMPLAGMERYYWWG